MVTITNEDFIEYTGIDLSLELKDLDDGYEKVDRTIRLWTTRVYREMGLSTTRARYPIFRISNKRNQRMHNRIWNVLS